MRRHYLPTQKKPLQRETQRQTQQRETQQSQSQQRQTQQHSTPVHQRHFSNSIRPVEQPVAPVADQQWANEAVICCPHCDEPVLITAIACGIFRHAALKMDLTQLPPHSSKEICEDVVTRGLVYGCGKPFRYDGKTVEKCDYI